MKNYTGDRLNFGLAAERARAFGLNVRVVIVDDDVALPDTPQARGVAGTLFVHKIAGALAEAGADLATVAAAAERVIAGTRSIGMSLDTCTVPGAPKEDRIPKGKAELGLGIHGEAGVEQVDYRDARGAVAMVAEKLAPFMPAGRPHVVLLNNLGGASVLEMGVLLHELGELGARRPHRPRRRPGGDDDLARHARLLGLGLPGRTTPISRRCSAPCAPAAWPGVHALGPGRGPRRSPTASGRSSRCPRRTRQRAPSSTRCCEILIAAEADLNQLDARAGDGDTGSTLAGAARALLAAMDDLPLADHTQLYRAIGLELSQTMGGSSGVLAGDLLRRGRRRGLVGMSLTDALEAGLARMQEIGGARARRPDDGRRPRPALACLAQRRHRPGRARPRAKAPTGRARWCAPRPAGRPISIPSSSKGRSTPERRP